MIEGVVGSLLVGQLKDAVEYQKFLGYQVELFLGKGWFFKQFAVKGDEEALNNIRMLFNEINRYV